VQFGLIFCGPVVINAVVEEHLRYVITIYHTAYLLIAPDVSNDMLQVSIEYIGHTLLTEAACRNFRQIGAAF